MSIRDMALVLLLALPAAGCGDRGRSGDEGSPDMRRIIVAFGDSLTAGAGVGSESSYPAKLQKKIDEAGHPYRVVNAGVSGETSSQGLRRIGDVLSLRPSIVIVEFGANDGFRGVPAETTRRNLAEIVERLDSAGAKVVLAGMEIPPHYGATFTRAFKNVFPHVARESGAALIPFFLEGVAGRPELNQIDGLHPTAEGYDVVVENVWDVLEPML